MAPKSLKAWEKPSVQQQSKVVLVTGGAKGVGRGISEQFLAAGYTVVVCGREQPAELPQKDGRSASFIAADVRKAEQVEALFAQIAERHGRLDVLVNSAGIGRHGDIESTTLADFRLMYRVNVEGTFLGCRAAVGAMKAHGGAIVNLSSVAGLIGVPDLAGYCASKGAVRLLTKSVALHCAKQGYRIRCNSLHPSFIDTPMVDAMAAALGDPAAAKAQLGRAAPLGRLGHVDDVTAAILYLASDEGAFVTGAELAIDGGLTAR